MGGCGPQSLVQSLSRRSHSTQPVAGPTRRAYGNPHSGAAVCSGLSKLTFYTNYTTINTLHKSLLEVAGAPVAAEAPVVARLQCA